MSLSQKIRSLPLTAGVYLYKNAEGEVIYVGKAKNLRSRVSSYFHEGRWEDAKTGTLVREAVDVDYIVVANNKEALALENHLIKQKKPRFNILLRDDKTYPYVKLTLAERYPRVYVTRRLRKDGSAYYGPYFPANLAYRIVDLIHRHFMVPSCKVDLTRDHPRPCLQFYIKRCLGPCVKDLTTPVIYAEAVRDVKLFLEGRQTDLVKSLRERMSEAAASQEFERAARYRDLISTVEQLQEKQRIATVEGDDADVFGYHYENQMLAVNLFHMRGGKVLDRREFFWEDLPEFGTNHAETMDTNSNHVGADASVRPDKQSEQESSPASATDKFHPGEFFSALVKQLYLAQPYVPRNIYVPVDFEDREELEEALSEQLAGAGGRATRVHITVPQRGDKRELIDLAGNNAKQSYDQRFRVLKPNARVIQEALQDALALPELPKRIECFDISHIQGAETVASMVVWEDGKMKKSDYRKFIIKTVEGVDDFASMREVVTRRYKRLCEESKLEDKKSMPSLVLIDGGLGQLHAAAQALEALEIINQPLAAIAKREEIIYVYGQEDDPIVLDHHSPVLHLVQMIRDEAHRFAVTFHRKRRQIRDRVTELREIPGVGESTTRRLLEHFGSLQSVKQADVAALSAVVTRSQAEAILEHFRRPN
ncbi:MAG: excinuclease ABC subunit UvrC [Terriglobales bacterium]